MASDSFLDSLFEGSLLKRGQARHKSPLLVSRLADPKDALIKKLQTKVVYLESVSSL